MTLEELRKEYSSDRVGPKILGEVREAVSKLVRRYDPLIYANAASWADAEEDLVQEVVAILLLEEGQLDYLMAVSGTLDDLRALLQRQIRRLLARRRQRTVIDNLLDRVRPILTGEAFARSQLGGRTLYRLAAASVVERNPTDSEIRQAAVRVAVIPRIAFHEGERAPHVYSSANLERALRALAFALPTSFELSDVDRVLRLVLTDWLPSFLEESEAVEVRTEAALSPEQEALVQDVTNTLISSLSPEQRLIVLRKLEGLSDGDLATQLGVSRPTAAARKEVVWQILERELADLETTTQRALISELSSRIAAGGINA